MKGGKIFLVGQKNESLQPMTESLFEREDILQELLEKYHDLLAGDQINPESPRRWIFVAREMGIPGEVDESDTWSLDHLFIDQDAIPTFVECKRASDTRIRREVVAQMLDYAANGTKYWTMERLRQTATETAQKAGISLDAKIMEILESENPDDIEDFWNQVEVNLQKGKVRLIFVSDSIPKELRRIVEFLNEQMVDTEVIAIEVKQYIGEGQKAIVPRVIGLTESARSKKISGKPKSIINRVEFLDKCSSDTASFFEYVLNEAEKRNQSINWGVKGFSVGVALSQEEKRAPIAFYYPPDRVEISDEKLEYLNASTQEIADMRKEMMAQGIFRESKKALLVRINSSNKSQVQKAYDLWLSLLNKLISEKRK